jgi:hypothetical protein
MTSLVNIAIPCVSFLLVNNEIIACALRVVQEQGTGAAPLNPRPPPPPPPHMPAVASCCVF